MGAKTISYVYKIPLDKVGWSTKEDRLVLLQLTEYQGKAEVDVYYKRASGRYWLFCVGLIEDTKMHSIIGADRLDFDDKEQREKLFWYFINQDLGYYDTEYGDVCLFGINHMYKEEE